MKVCENCNVSIIKNEHNCILCGAVTEERKAGGLNCESMNTYPNLSKMMAQYNLVYRVALFISLFGIAMSVLVNLLLVPGFLWCLIVAACIAYFWLVVPPLLRKGADFAKQTEITVLLTSLLVVAIDFITGYRGWSLNYVIPSLCMAGTCIILLMIILNRTNWAQYVLYQVLVGVFGLVPLILYLFGLSNNLLMVLICAAVSLGSLLGATVFADKSIKSEFKRRFHL